MSASACRPFNGASYIGEALRSVLEQSIEDSELIVLDDGSSDGTADVVATIGDERVRLVRNPVHLRLTIYTGTLAVQRVPAAEARRRPAPETDVRR